MDKTDPTQLLVYRNRVATAPKLSHKVNVLDSASSTSEGDDGEPIVTRRGSRQKRAPPSRKTSGFTTTGSRSGRNSSVGTTWKVVGNESGDIISVTSEQMAHAEKVASEMGMCDDVVIENAGSSTFVSC